MYINIYFIWRIYEGNSYLDQTTENLSVRLFDIV